MKLTTVTSSIKGFHVYRKSPDVGEKLKYVLEERNQHSNTAIKVAVDANEKIGPIPDGLSKVVVPAPKKEIVLSVEAKGTGHPIMQLKENGRLEAKLKFRAFTGFMVPKKANPNLEIN